MVVPIATGKNKGRTMPPGRTCHSSLCDCLATDEMWLFIYLARIQNLVSKMVLLPARGVSSHIFFFLIFAFLYIYHRYNTAPNLGRGVDIFFTSFIFPIKYLNRKYFCGWNYHHINDKYSKKSCVIIFFNGQSLTKITFLVYEIL